MKQYRNWSTLAGRMKITHIAAYLVLILASSVLSASLSRADTQPLAVLALVKVKPGTEQAFKAAASDLIGPSRKESGCIDYVFQQSTEDPTEFSTIEHWKSEEALAEHVQSPQVKLFFSRVKDLFVPGFPQIKKYRVFEKRN
jgi:quinol monooxygenase YgiN